MKFEYPIPVSGEDATELLGHKNAVGHYPMGRLFNWHGGLHVFEREYAPIKAIADGVVIAYRVGKTAIECEGVKFSNSFVLIKHKYVSPQGRELPFYSLYNHLMTFDELAQNKVPDIFGVQKFEVSGQTIKGLFMRKASNFDEKVLVPKGMTVTIDFETNAQSAGATQWAADKKKEQYKKVKYVDPFTKTEYEDYFIFYTSDRFTNVTGSHYEVDTSEDKTLKKGEEIKELNGSHIKYVVPNGTAVVVAGFVGDQKEYYRVKRIGEDKCEEDLMVLAKSLAGAKEKALCFEEGDCGDVVTGEDCDIEVSAGDVVGFVGLNGFANNESHRSVHVEVFTNEASLSSFLKGVEGEKNDVKDTLNYTKIARGAKLSLKYPLTILKDDEIKVEEFPEGEDEKYCRISLAKVVREVTYYYHTHKSAANSYLSYKSGTQVTGADGEIVSAQYTPAKLKELNLLFYNTLQKDSILDWVASPAADRRQVSFCPSAGSLTLWTTKAALGISSKPSAPIKLTADLQELYYKRPENDEIEFEVEQDIFKKTADLEKIGSEEDQNCWYKVKAVRSQMDDNGKRTYSSVEGYIKSDDSNVSSVSAYDWEAFGFEMLDIQPDTFVYNNSTEGITEDKAPEFLKAVWKHIDLNGDGELSRPELAKALKDSLAQQRLSRLVCYHQSEWGVDYEALKSDVEVLLDEGINKEQDEEKKQKLTEKKDKTLASLETKVKSFNFWDKVKEPVKVSEAETPPASIPEAQPLQIGKQDTPIVGNLDPVAQPSMSNSETGATNEIEYVSMPKKPKFWHFHPIAFVEQMKRFSGACFCDKDITVEAFEEIFGKGPWFTGKLGVVDMKRDYPEVYNISTQKLVDALNRTMRKYEINSCLQKAHFLGQIGAETGFQFTAECADGKDYDIGTHKALHESYIAFCAFLKKYSGLADNQEFTEHEKHIESRFNEYALAYEKYKSASSAQKLTNEYKVLKDMHDKYPTFKKEKEKYDGIYDTSYQYSSKYTKFQNWRRAYYRYTSCIENGNDSFGDGLKYRGHGLLQLTWRDNYVKFKDRLKIDVVSNPELLSNNITNACNMAGSWWKSPLTGAGNLNIRADIDDMIYVTYGINGGFNGLNHRYKYTRNAIISLGCKECLDYKHIDLGNYTYESSEISKINAGKRNEYDIKLILKNAKQSYEAK